MKKVILFKFAVSAGPDSVRDLIYRVANIASQQTHETIEFARTNNLIVKFEHIIDHDYYLPYREKQKPMSMGYGRVYTMIDESNPLLSEIIIKHGNKITTEDI